MLHGTANAASIIIHAAQPHVDPGLVIQAMQGRPIIQSSGYLYQFPDGSTITNAGEVYTGSLDFMEY